MFNGCEVCGEMGRDLVFAGGFRGYLCTEHGAEWHEHVLPLSEFAVFQEASREVDAAGAMLISGKGTKEDFLEARRKLARATDIMYWVAKAWLAEKKAPKEPTGAVDEN